MSGFSSDWLALREPADRRARNARLLDAVVAHLARSAAVPTITDLACGTGATLRALAPRLAGAQRWRLVDHDAVLLERAAELAAGASGPSHARARAAVTVDTLRADLAREVDAIVALPSDLVTTSAFLDLASQGWLAQWVAALRRHRRPVYAALSYDGRVACSPADPLDRVVLAAFDEHQRRDKGLGGALGPAAAATAVRLLRAAGFVVRVGRADWRLGRVDRVLQRHLLEGWHAAVAETGRIDPAALSAWRARRLAAIDAGRCTIAVGHLDLFARLPVESNPRSQSMSAPSR
jgi:SAM-dependent methyltransferase